MPKTNAGGATYHGHSGIVADGEGKLSELDPSRNVDGSVVEGFESEDRELTDRDAEVTTTEVGPQESGATASENPDGALSERSDHAEKEVSPSDGSNSGASRSSRVTSTSKKH